MSEEQINNEDDGVTHENAEAEAVSEAESAEALLAAKDAEIAELKDRLLRAAAETENVRRRLEREKADASAYAATGFARDMLSIADNLARALGSIPDAAREEELVKAVITGVEMTARELDAVFQRQGIARIESIGLPLDPHRHQAMMEVPTNDQEAGTIVQELQSGYVMKDRLLRPALVGVAKAAD